MTKSRVRFLWINLTEDAVSIRFNGVDIQILPSGTVARCVVARYVIFSNGVEVTVEKVTSIEGLPKPTRNRRYIVDFSVLAQVQNRKDVFSVSPSGVFGTKAFLSACRIDDAF